MNKKDLFELCYQDNKEKIKLMKWDLIKHLIPLYLEI